MQKIIAYRNANKIYCGKIKKSKNLTYNPRNIRPVKNSTIGYCQDIFVLQDRHFPLRKIKLKTGNSSNHCNVLPQEKHADLPFIFFPVL